MSLMGFLLMKETTLPLSSTKKPQGPSFCVFHHANSYVNASNDSLPCVHQREILSVTFAYQYDQLPIDPNASQDGCLFQDALDDETGSDPSPGPSCSSPWRNRHGRIDHGLSSKIQNVSKKHFLHSELYILYGLGKVFVILSSQLY